MRRAIDPNTAETRPQERNRRDQIIFPQTPQDRFFAKIIRSRTFFEERSSGKTRSR